MYIHWYVLNVHAVAVKEHYMLTMYQPYRQNNIETISHMAKRKKTIIVSSYLYIITCISAECGDFVIEDYPDHTYLNA